MALSRRNGKRFEANIWPGFVDAMTALLLVLVFVLSIFMIVQYTLSQTITTQDNELDELGEEVRSLADALGLERAQTEDLRSQVDSLSGALAEKSDEFDIQAAFIATLTAQNEAQTDQIARFEDQVAAFLARQTTLQDRIAALSEERDEAAETAQGLTARLDELEAGLAREITENEAAQLALAQARSEVDAQTEAARLAAAQREALQAMVSDLQDENAQKTAQIEATEAAELASVALAEDLRKRLQDSDAELTAMSLALEDKRREAEETLTLLAAARAAEGELNERLARALSTVQATENAQVSQAELREELAAALADKRAATEQAAAAMSEAQEQQALLNFARASLETEREISEKGQLEVEALNQQIAQLRSQLNSLQGLLDQSADRDADANVQIENLGNQLNAALAQVASEQRKLARLEAEERARLEAEASELRNYRSEFFGQLRTLLGDLDGVRIEGDRFIFSSEVLFEPGSATLAEDGRRDITQVAEILQQIADDIPDDLNWIIRVDGHTDDIPLGRNSRYEDNWELSQARALSVVRFMSDELGIAPDRLAANGFGEYQPINPADTPQARAQNRRIELKLTER